MITTGVSAAPIERVRRAPSTPDITVISCKYNIPAALPPAPVNEREPIKPANTNVMPRRIALNKP